MRRASFAAGVLAALAPRPAQAKRLATPPPIVTTLPAFTFRGGLYLNLHHRLYREAAVRAAAPHGETVISGVESFGDADRTAWFHAIHVYELAAYARDLASPALLRITAALAAVDEGKPLASAPIPVDLKRALVEAASPYRKHLWRDDDAKNRAWSNNALGLVRAFGDPIARRLANVFRTPWPSGPYRVEIVRYVEPLGSYASASPSMTVVASGTPLNAGRTALEVIFDGAARALVSSDRGTIGSGILAESARERKAPPQDLWRAMLFFTVARVVYDAFHADLEAPYRPFIQTAEMFPRLWPAYQKPIASRWQPYIDGTGDLPSALRSTVADVLAATHR